VTIAACSDFFCDFIRPRSSFRYLSASSASSIRSCLTAAAGLQSAPGAPIFAIHGYRLRTSRTPEVHVLSTLSAPSQHHCAADIDDLLSQTYYTLMAANKTVTLFRFHGTFHENGRGLLKIRTYARGPQQAFIMPVGTTTTFSTSLAV